MRTLPVLCAELMARCQMRPTAVSVLSRSVLGEWGEIADRKAGVGKRRYATEALLIHIDFLIFVF